MACGLLITNRPDSGVLHHTSDSIGGMWAKVTARIAVSGSKKTLKEKSVTGFKTRRPLLCRGLLLGCCDFFAVFVAR